MNGDEVGAKIRSLVSFVYDKLDTDKKYIGVLLCEGTYTSVDYQLYSEVYPKLLVVPVGGWSDVKRFVPSLRKRLHGYHVFGIIDRDSASKKDVSMLQERGIYCTKLPFIENIISCPEMIRIFCRELGIGYESHIDFIESNLMGILARKLKDALPINIPIKEDEEITSVTIKIKKKNGMNIEKTVNCANIMYAYRDKAVANETACALGILGRNQYYKFFKECLKNERLKKKITRCASAYLPQIELPIEDV